MVNITIREELKEDYLDMIRYWHNKGCIYRRLSNFPLCGILRSRIIFLIEEADRNKSLYIRLYCGDDFLGSVSRRLGIVDIVI